MDVTSRCVCVVDLWAQFNFVWVEGSEWKRLTDKQRSSWVCAAADVNLFSVVIRTHKKLWERITTSFAAADGLCGFLLCSLLTASCTFSHESHNDSYNHGLCLKTQKQFHWFCEGLMTVSPASPQLVTWYNIWGHVGKDQSVQTFLTTSIQRPFIIHLLILSRFQIWVEMMSYITLWKYISAVTFVLLCEAVCGSVLKCVTSIWILIYV